MIVNHDLEEVVIIWKSKEFSVTSLNNLQVTLFTFTYKYNDSGLIHYLLNGTS